MDTQNCLLRIACSFPLCLFCLNLFGDVYYDVFMLCFLGWIHRKIPVKYFSIEALLMSFKKAKLLGMSYNTFPGQCYGQPVLFCREVCLCLSILKKKNIFFLIIVHFIVLCVGFCVHVVSECQKLLFFFL